MPSQNDSALSQLQSTSQVELLDAVDRLRLDGFQGELDLPQLVVCGDQSSGKSSVLEAISQVRFPASDGLCTRFASEIILRRAEEESMTVRIEPGKHRAPEDREHLLAFRPPAEMNKPEDFAEAISAASSYLVAREPGVGFFEDKLICSVSGPVMPPLTLVDLPGIIHASEADEEQAKKDIKTVRRIVESYMHTPSSIILAVLAADNNFSNQAVMQMARKADPDGERTLGIITKPDKVYRGSPSENSCLHYARNRARPLRLGWHVLCNRNPETATASTEERDQMEAEFFTRAPWSTLTASVIGASTLRHKLSGILLQSLRKSMPILLSDLRRRVAECQGHAKKLGEARIREEDQRYQLADMSQQLHGLVTDGIRGDYEKAFFNTRMTEVVSTRRLRARLRDELDQFAIHMREKGSRYKIDETLPSADIFLDLSLELENVDIDSNPRIISFADFAENADRHCRHNRSRELPETTPANFVGAIFRAQSIRWEPISEHYARTCCEIVGQFFKEALHSVAPAHIVQSVMATICSDRLEDAFVAFDDKVKELLEPYKTNTPIILDMTFMKNMGPVQENWTPVMRDVVKMHSYYKIAQAVFIENFANLAVESCLIKSLSRLFDPVTVMSLSAEDVKRLTLEPANVRHDREQNKQRLHVLQDILQICNKHASSFGDTLDPPVNEEQTGGINASDEGKDRTPTTPTRSAPHIRYPYVSDQARVDPAYQTPPLTPEPSSRKGKGRMRADSGGAHRPRRTLSPLGA